MVVTTNKLGFGKDSEHYLHIGSCRSAERLLRFLLFLQRIIENMKNNPEDSFSACWRSAYNKELANYHGFFLRNTVKGIFYLVPSRESFLKGITNDYADCPEEEIVPNMVKMIDNSEIVTSHLKNYLKERDHFELP